MKRSISVAFVLLAAALAVPSAASARAMLTGIADDAVLLPGGPEAADAV